MRQPYRIMITVIALGMCILLSGCIQAPFTGVYQVESGYESLGMSEEDQETLGGVVILLEFAKDGIFNQYFYENRTRYLAFTGNFHVKDNQFTVLQGSSVKLLYTYELKTENGEAYLYGYDPEYEEPLILRKLPQ